MAAAAMRILRRNTLGTDVLEPWVHRIGAAANPFGGPATTTRSPAPTPPQAFLRALFVQLSLAPDAAAGAPRPAARGDRGAPDDQRSLPAAEHRLACDPARLAGTDR